MRERNVCQEGKREQYALQAGWAPSPPFPAIKLRRAGLPGREASGRRDSGSFKHICISGRRCRMSKTSNSREPHRAPSGHGYDHGPWPLTPLVPEAEISINARGRIALARCPNLLLIGVFTERSIVDARTNLSKRTSAPFQAGRQAVEREKKKQWPGPCLQCNASAQADLLASPSVQVPFSLVCSGLRVSGCTQPSLNLNRDCSGLFISTSHLACAWAWARHSYMICQAGTIDRPELHKIGVRKRPEPLHGGKQAARRPALSIQRSYPA